MYYKVQMFFDSQSKILENDVLKYISKVDLIKYTTVWL